MTLQQHLWSLAAKLQVRSSPLNQPAEQRKMDSFGAFCDLVGRFPTKGVSRDFPERERESAREMKCPAYLF